MAERITDSDLDVALSSKPKPKTEVQPQPKPQPRQVEANKVDLPDVPMGARGADPQSITELFRLAKAVYSSGRCPGWMKSATDTMVAMQYGAEFGIGPVTAASKAVVINGLPSWPGEIALGLVRRAGVTEFVRWGWSEEPGGDAKSWPDNYEAWIEAKRKDDSGVYRESVTVGDAKRARLWGSKQNWQQYPKDMLLWKAVARMVRRGFSDCLGGLRVAEDLMGHGPENTVAIEPPKGEDPLLANADATAEPKPPLIEGKGKILF